MSIHMLLICLQVVTIVANSVTIYFGVKTNREIKRLEASHHHARDFERMIING
jgi:uncharacterized membrane protein